MGKIGGKKRWQNKWKNWWKIRWENRWENWWKIGGIFCEISMEKLVEESVEKISGSGGWVSI